VDKKHIYWWCLERDSLENIVGDIEKDGLK
jgi:hypothetical protein